MKRMKLMLALAVSTGLMGTACAQESDTTTQTTDVTAPGVPDNVTVPGGVDPMIVDIFADPDADHWRKPDQDNLVYMETVHGLIIIELAPDFAPKHVEQIKKLTGQGFYNRIKFHRVIDDFMVQGGDPDGDGAGGSTLPDIPGEFTFRRDDTLPVALVGQRALNLEDPRSPTGQAGYVKGFPVVTQPTAQAALTADGKVDAVPLHCPGVASMARTANPDSANSQFFLMRYTADHLNAQYSVWGRVVSGLDVVRAIKVGTVGQDEGFEPDRIETMELGSEKDAAEQVDIRILDTTSPEFSRWLKTQSLPGGQMPDICDMTPPVIIVE